MRLALQDAWAGRRRRSLACPACGGDRFRPSRRHYEGVWFRVFQVRPVTCAECGLCFPIAITSGSGHLRARTLDLDLPFKPLEVEASEKTAEARAARQGPGRPGFLACPVCGSSSVNQARTATDREWRKRFEVKDDYRCLECNAGFKRINPIRSAVLAGALMSVLGGLTYLAIATLDPVRTNPKLPAIQQKQIPPLPPPVFRKRLGVETPRLTPSAG